jgi:hypothetical protein
MGDPMTNETRRPPCQLGQKKNKGKNTKNVLLCPLLSQIKFKRCGQRRARTHKKQKNSFFLFF